jgi:hypothetical protein
MQSMSKQYNILFPTILVTESSQAQLMTLYFFFFFFFCFMKAIYPGALNGIPVSEKDVVKIYSKV